MSFVRDFSIVILYNDAGKVFMQDRTSISKRGEHWGFFGGGLEGNETFEEALIRETQEELSIDITGDYTYIGNTVFELESVGKQTTYMYIVKYNDLYKNNIKVCEGDGGKFFSLDQCSGLKMAPWGQIGIEILKEYFSRNK
ncbi:NUDIX domain-containing protein [Candidatus Gracilibacteria bacterium]|nr:NUDIX domain-containing protein [Candidatus Gracilibacteria bacterium]